MNDTDTPGIVAEIFARFARYGHLEYGEFVTQQQHALQTAHLAEGDGADGARAGALVAVDERPQRAPDCHPAESASHRRDHLAAGLPSLRDHEPR